MKDSHLKFEQYAFNIDTMLVDWKRIGTAIVANQTAIIWRKRDMFKIQFSMWVYVILYWN